MSSPPSVPNSYWGSDTFDPWAGALKAPDRQRVVAAVRAPLANVLWCSDGWRYVGAGTSAMPSWPRVALPLLVDEEGHDIEHYEQDHEAVTSPRSRQAVVVVASSFARGRGAGVWPDSGLRLVVRVLRSVACHVDGRVLMMKLVAWRSMMRWSSPDSSSRPLVFRRDFRRSPCR